MSYCSSCGAYLPDWAAECPACGAPREPAAGPKRARKAPDSAAAQAARPKRKAAAEEGEYHYTYKKASGGGGAAPQGSGARRRTADKGTFTCEGTKQGSGGAFRYEAEDRRGSYAGAYTSDAKKNRGLAALCYFGPFFLLSWLLKPKSSFVRYHVNQGLALFLCWIVINIFDFIPFMWVVNIFGLICFFCGVSNALRGKRKPLPVIGDITLIK